MKSSSDIITQKVGELLAQTLGSPNVGEALMQSLKGIGNLSSELDKLLHQEYLNAVTYSQSFQTENQTPKQKIVEAKEQMNITQTEASQVHHEVERLAPQITKTIVPPPAVLRQISLSSNT